MALEVRGIRRDEVTAAASIIADGTLSGDVERPDQVDAYWSGVEETRARGGDVLVVVESGEVLAICQVIVFRHFQHTAGRCAELESVYVRSDRRGAGIGAQLLAAAEDVARTAGCYRIQLTSRNVRADAHRFYATNGYEQSSQGFRKALADLA